MNTAFTSESKEWRMTPPTPGTAGAAAHTSPSSGAASTSFQNRTSAPASSDPSPAPGVRGIPGIPTWKRVLDLTLILLLSPIWLPVMVILTLFIKCTSKGPVFFRQNRVGQGGVVFQCFKFRSMKVNAETRSHESHLAQLMRGDAPMTKLDAAGDSRLIFGGRLFRATGLDELPQLINVLRGDMSLVGPRPCTQFEFAQYDAWQKRRFEAPAGLTGYWQTNGKNRTTFKEMIAMDIYYAEHLSLAFDLWVLMRTPPALGIQVLDSQRSKFLARQGRHLAGHQGMEATTGSA